MAKEEEKAAAEAVKAEAAAKKEEEKAAAEAADESSSEENFGFDVQDPAVLRPEVLPLVIKEPKGGWKNPAQAEYAAVLNGYAYKNRKKWGKKKQTLLKNLAEIGESPDAIVKYRGQQGSLSYGNQLIQGNKDESA